ncbi:MAG TPA: sugar ABC transporter permease [Chloroflexota bacterium]
MAVRRLTSGNGPYVLALLPALGLVLLFFLGPALWAIYASFTNMALVGADAANPRFVGLANYQQLFRDPDFFTVLRNSVAFVIGSAVLGQFLLGLGLAVLLDHAEHRGFKGGNLVYAAVLLAWVDPSLIAGFLWAAMFDFYFGTLNVALKSIGLPPQNWLGDQAMLAIIVANTWRGTAFTMLIFLSGLKTIPTEIYEAARVDGANAWRRFWDHTLPNLTYIAILALMNITIATLGAFILILGLTGGGPGIKTEVLSLYAYHTAFQARQIGYGSSVAMIMLAINLLFAAVYLRVFRVERGR